MVCLPSRWYFCGSIASYLAERTMSGETKVEGYVCKISLPSQTTLKPFIPGAGPTYTTASVCPLIREPPTAIPTVEAAVGNCFVYPNRACTCSCSDLIKWYSPGANT